MTVPGTSIRASGWRLPVQRASSTMAWSDAPAVSHRQRSGYPGANRGQSVTANTHDT